ncbi:MAG: transporter permease subunit [Clostridiales bacterium]|nr:transporter permease subunit [Clostridiales bacterium]
MKKHNKKNISSDNIFDFIVTAISIIIIIIVSYPIVFVVSASFSDPVKVMNGEVWFFPSGFNIEAYKKIMENRNIWVGYKNSLIYTILGTLINVFMTTLAAYPLSRKDLPGRNVVMIFITFTMFFSGGLIPTYLLIKSLHLNNTIWVMLIPNAIATYNLIVMRTYFQNNIPIELQEAASLDGCSDFKLLVSIVLPLSAPIIAVMVLFYSVGHWNAFFNALIYLRKESLYPLQLILRDILLQNNLENMNTESFGMKERLMLGESIKYAVIIVASVPVLLLYPFVQRYFVKGIMVGAIKG